MKDQKKAEEIAAERVQLLSPLLAEGLDPAKARELKAQLCLAHGLSERTSTYQDSTGRTLPCFYLTRKGCDMVANKLTGNKGILFTAAYVSKFEAMEKALANPNQIAANEAKKLRAEAMHLNAKTRQVKLIKDLARQFQSHLSSESVQSLVAGVTEMLMGQPLLPLPEVEKTYTATEIAQEAGVSRYLIGRLANIYGLKIKEYGLTVLDTVPPEGKQVPVFRYNEKGKKKLMELVGARK